MGPTRVPLTAISESSVSSDTSSSLGDAESEVEIETDNENENENDNDASSIKSEHQHVVDVVFEEHADFPTKKRKRTLDSFSYCGPQSTKTTTQPGCHEQYAGHSQQRPNQAGANNLRVSMVAPDVCKATTCMT